MMQPQHPWAPAAPVPTSRHSRASAALERGDEDEESLTAAKRGAPAHGSQAWCAEVLAGARLHQQALAAAVLAAALLALWLHQRSGTAIIPASAAKIMTPTVHRPGPAAAVQLQHTTYYKPRHRERHGEAIAGATAASNGRNVNASQSEKPVQEPGEELVSAGKPAQASVRGNLAPATVITGPEQVGDWLTDRWQAAKDMSGTPIEGEHWVEIDLQEPVMVTRFTLDWESAYAKDWSMEGRLANSSRWEEMTNPKAATITTQTADKHVRQAFALPNDWAMRHAHLPPQALSEHGVRCAAPAAAVRHVRLLIRKRATLWGVSLWRLHVWGSRVAACRDLPKLSTSSF